jgi:hypothetical protein
MTWRKCLAGRYKTRVRGRNTNVGAEDSTWDELIGGCRKMQSDITRVVSSNGSI